MTAAEQYQQLMQQLCSIYDAGEAASIAALVNEHITGIRNMNRLQAENTLLTMQQTEQFRKACMALMNHRPVQYVLHEAWFMEQLFYVDESVLIPRPETEELVAWAAAEKAQYLQNGPVLLPGTREAAAGVVLDIGTGSGCIVISIKKRIPNAAAFAVDTSEAALAIASKNAKALDADVHFKHLDFLDETQWHQLPPADIIISNPPYIPIGEKELLDKNVTAWEPELALFVPDHDPLLFYRKIALFGKTHLNKNGGIFLECHQQYIKKVVDLYAGEGYEVVLKKDIFDNDRMLKATRP